MFDKQYVFYGKHAKMVKKLTAKLSDEVNKGFFATNYDVYRLAPIIGWVYNRKADVDKSIDDETKIFAEKMRDEKDDLVFNYRTLMLLKHKDQENRMDIAFKMDYKDEERKPYDKEYDQYVLGGVEEIYEHIFGQGETIDDFVMNYYEFVQELNVRLYE